MRLRRLSKVRALWPVYVKLKGMFSPDYGKRDYLLPPGCKDLIDVIKLEAARESKTSQRLGELPGVPPPVTGEILVAGSTTPKQLAELLGQKPFKIIADLMELGVFATVNQVVGFEAISKVARRYGYLAKKLPQR